MTKQLERDDYHTFYLRLGENIRLIRDQKNLNQETLASHLGFSRISISNIETGKQKIQLHSLVKLSDLLQVTLAELLPAEDYHDIVINNKLERKITETEVASNLKSLERVKDFIKMSTLQPNT